MGAAKVMNIPASNPCQILENPRFRELTSERAWLRWGLSFVVLAMFFGMIIFMSMAPAVLAMPLGPTGATFGIAVAFLMFIGIVTVTGFYVHRSNKKFDTLTQSVINEFVK